MSDSVGQWASVSEAAAAAGTSDRTVWRWVHAGVVESKTERRGQRDIRLVNLVSLPPSDSDSQRPTVTDAGVESQRIKDADQESPPLLECACCKVRAGEVDHLRAQLDRRAEEAQRQADAERELRCLLLQLERTNAELAGALVMKALPPATETPVRVRWWQLWRSRV